MKENISCCDLVLSFPKKLKYHVVIIWGSKMLKFDSHTLVRIAAYLPKEDLGQFLLANKCFNSLYHGSELWLMKLKVEYNMRPSDCHGNLMKLYTRLSKLDKSCTSIVQAAMNGELSVVKYLLSLTPRVVHSTSWVVFAAGNDHVEIIEYFVSLCPVDLRTGPLTDAANDASARGKTNVLEYLASLTPPILPTQN